MPNIFAGTEPPAWLERATSQQPGQLGRIIGEIVGGLADSAEIAIGKAEDKQKQGIQTSWIKELPGSIKPGLFNARMDLQNPLWRIQADQAKLNMVEQGLRIQNDQSLIDLRKQNLQMRDHDQTTFSKWMQDHPTWDSRQNAEWPTLFTSEGNKALRDVQLGDAKTTQAEAATASIKAFQKDLDELTKANPKAAGKYAPYVGKNVPQKVWDQMGEDLAAAQEKKRQELKPETMDIDLPGGKKMTVIFNPKTGRFEQPKDKEEEIRQRATEKATEDQRDVIKSQLKEINKELLKAENQSPEAQLRLKTERNKSQKALDALKPGAMQTQTAPTTLSAGTEYKGYRFKGGDPSKPESWEKLP